jgi:hypothetical protein
MIRLCTFVGMFVAGYAGWYLGDAAGLGLFGSFIVGGVCSIAGVWLGWKFAQRYS